MELLERRWAWRWSADRAGPTRQQADKRPWKGVLGRKKERAVVGFSSRVTAYMGERKSDGKSKEDTNVPTSLPL